jgi:hypothetical protein
VKRQKLFGDIIFALFALLQVLDGVLTYQGIQHFGIGVDIEGNMLLRIAMATAGVRATLLIAKLGSIGGGWFIHSRKYHRVLAVLTAFYAVAAIFPWIVLLFTDFSL